ncbi:hypothetical protein N7535_001715 [Penicillium sp. DV-2018c]|nr:hypothetical protein N7535_001715 [Penicillium sp. DV-2018c]
MSTAMRTPSQAIIHNGRGTSFASGVGVAHNLIDRSLTYPEQRYATHEPEEEQEEYSPEANGQSAYHRRVPHPQAGELEQQYVVPRKILREHCIPYYLLNFNMDRIIEVVEEVVPRSESKNSWRYKICVAPSSA